MFLNLKKDTDFKTLIAVILLFISATGMRAQGVRLFTSADGIPSSRFIGIHQDAEGYIWISNHIGLSRMIGSTITNFYETPGKDKLKSNQVNAFATDSTGQLWLGTTSGLQLFHPKTEQFEQIPFNVKDLRQTDFKNPSLQVTDLIALPNRNQMLVCLGIHGFVVLDVHTHNVLQHETNIFQKALKQVVGNQVYCDSKQRLWIATNNGLVLMDIKSMRVKPLLFDQKNGIYANNLEILRILEDKKTHTILFGDTKYSVLEYDEQTNTIRPFSKQPSVYNNVQCLLQLKNGTILVGCDRNGIGQLDHSKKTIRHYPLLDSSFGLSECKIHQLLEDSWGNIYVCLYQKGLLVIPPFTGGFRFRAITNGIVKHNNTAITSIVKNPEKKLYVSTDGNGIFVGNDFDRMHRLSLPSSCNGNIYKILAGKDGKLWIATYGSGLFVSKHGIVE